MSGAPQRAHGRPPGQCTVCAHPERQAIDAKIRDGVPQRTIAAQYAGISASSVQRHGARHLSDAGLVTVTTSQANSTLAKTERLLDEMQRTLAKAKRAKGTREQVAAIGEMRRMVELLARLRGELKDGPTVTVNLAASAEWATVRDAIFGALDGHPDARVAVAQALLRVEGQGGVVESTAEEIQ